MKLNKQNYDPMDDDSDTGYRRPPRDAACILDYFAELGFIGDEGEFAAAEMNVLINDPETFFNVLNQV